MSVIVAIKNKNGVIVGADTQATKWKNKFDGIQKIYKNENDNVIMGCVGDLRDCNLIPLRENWIYYKDVIKKTEIDLKYIVENVVIKMFEHFAKYHRVRQKDCINSLLSYFVFCTNKRIFIIDPDGAVVEGRNYIAVGCGEELVSGYLNTIEDLYDKSDLEIEDIIKSAIKSACKNDVFVGEEIDILKCV